MSVLKECFEVLQLKDLAEILAKVKPRALCPALSSEQVEKLQLGDRRMKNYSNMAVVVVDVSSEKDTAKMIETFFKDLNPRNESEREVSSAGEYRGEGAVGDVRGRQEEGNQIWVRDPTS